MEVGEENIYRPCHMLSQKLKMCLNCQNISFHFKNVYIMYVIYVIYFLKVYHLKMKKSVYLERIM